VGDHALLEALHSQGGLPRISTAYDYGLTIHWERFMSVILEPSMSSS
jgi:hypothetical protein